MRLWHPMGMETYVQSSIRCILTLGHHKAMHGKVAVVNGFGPLIAQPLELVVTAGSCRAPGEHLCDVPLQEFQKGAIVACSCRALTYLGPPSDMHRSMAGILLRGHLHGVPQEGSNR